jgi:hypothetical protein
MGQDIAIELRRHFFRFLKHEHTKNSRLLSDATESFRSNKKKEHQNKKKVEERGAKTDKKKLE